MAHLPKAKVSTITLELPAGTANRLRTCCKRMKLTPSEVFEIGLALLFPAKITAKAKPQTVGLVVWDHIFSTLPKKPARKAKP